MTATPGSQAFDDPGVFRELPLVNRIRPRIKAWREGGYLGASGITKRLLEHWRDLDERDFRRFFFCQLEAIETLIWLVEAPPAERQGIVIPGDGGPFTRLCSKMATGTGKTIVMTMLIAWQTLNKVTYPQDTRYSKNVSRRCPRADRAEPAGGARARQPRQLLRRVQHRPAGTGRRLRQGRVLVRNWHALGWDTEEQIAKRRSVDKRGAKSDEAYVREVLGEMAAARNILVINDEAHHAWRVPTESKVKGCPRRTSRRRRSGSARWTASTAPGNPGLPRLQRHAVRALGKAEFRGGPVRVDRERLRAQRCYRVGAGQDPSGRDSRRRADGADYKSRLYHIYNDPDVKDDLNRKAEEQEPLPDLVTNGYYLLGKDWQETAKKWRKRAQDTAGDDHRRQPHRDRRPGEVRLRPWPHPHRRTAVPERTLHIDSKVLDKAESQVDAPQIDGQEGRRSRTRSPRHPCGS